MTDKASGSILRDGALIGAILLVLLTVRIETPDRAAAGESVEPPLKHARMLPDLIVPEAEAAGFTKQNMETGRPVDAASAARRTRDAVLSLPRQILIVRPAEVVPARLSKPKFDCPQSRLAICS
jgi:hypothetical protein